MNGRQVGGGGGNAAMRLVMVAKGNSENLIIDEFDEVPECALTKEWFCEYFVVQLKVT